MTFSLAGRCERDGTVGGIVCSSSIAVPARCLWGSPSGIVLSQNVTDPKLGQIGVELLDRGYGAQHVLDTLVSARAHAQWRQLAVLDAHGNGATFTGERGLGVTGVARGRDCVAAGNLLAGAHVPQAMVEAFDASADQPLAERLVRALEAGAAAGGEAGPVYSAGFVVYGGPTWPIANLRVDWSDRPLADLRALWERYAPQMNDYVTRARDPGRAPSYGVPGDL
ncbi:DUF1028 domain-containing protein [Burkholderia guangdongensis]|uniref:DUF1028 domain-containing protein n=1 Tax=Burkholderia guangdongensis TaxID=1792500 RepID=UPI0015C93297|nr:DUF1028 domain-containing protein [Burkholderia guangdongensis]